MGSCCLVQVNRIQLRSSLPCPKIISSGHSRAINNLKTYVDSGFWYGTILNGGNQLSTEVAGRIKSVYFVAGHCHIQTSNGIARSVVCPPVGHDITFEPKLALEETIEKFVIGASIRLGDAVVRAHDASYTSKDGFVEWSGVDFVLGASKEVRGCCRWLGEGLTGHLHWSWKSPGSVLVHC